MPAILIPGRAAKGQRPSGPFGLNAASEQAQGLLAWMPGGVTQDPLTRGTYTRGTGASGVLPGISPQGGVAWEANANSGVSGTARAIVQTVGRSATLAQPLTLAMWISIGAVAGGSDALWAVSDGATSYHSLQYHPPGGNGWAVWTTGGVPMVSSFVTASAGDFTHVVGACKGDGTANLYLNGVSSNAAPVPRSASTGDITLVGAFYDPGVNFSGILGDWRIHDARLYAGQLNQQQVSTLYNAQTRWDLYWQPGRRVYVDVGAAATFNPAWARNRNVLLQPGL